MLTGIILAYTVGPKDYAVVIGTAVGALVGYLWDRWAERKKQKKK
jgi:F0F1-type ATP synthase assembly protein I